MDREVQSLPSALSREAYNLMDVPKRVPVISIVTVAEVMQGPLKKGNMKTAIAVKEYLLNFPNTICQEITRDVVDRVGNDQRVSWLRLRTIDSLIIAWGLAHDVDRIVSNDGHFKKALPSKLVLALDKT